MLMLRHRYYFGIKCNKFLLSGVNLVRTIAPFASITVRGELRQGRILSPKLFTLYVNQLVNKLIVCNAGCYFNSMCINHVMYADDICLLAPTASAMQSLLDVCYEYGTDNDIKFNPIKCTYLYLKNL